jgi:hypothetical protein
MFVVVLLAVSLSQPLQDAAPGETGNVEASLTNITQSVNNAQRLPIDTSTWVYLAFPSIEIALHASVILKALYSRLGAEVLALDEKIEFFYPSLISRATLYNRIGKKMANLIKSSRFYYGQPDEEITPEERAAAQQLVWSRPVFPPLPLTTRTWIFFTTSTDEMGTRIATELNVRYHRKGGRVRKLNDPNSYEFRFPRLVEKAEFYTFVGKLAPEINDIRFHYGETDDETTVIMKMYEVGPFQLGQVLTHGHPFGKFCYGWV